MATMNFTGILVFSERWSDYSIMCSPMIALGTGLLILLNCHKLCTELSELVTTDSLSSAARCWRKADVLSVGLPLCPCLVADRPVGRRKLEKECSLKHRLQ